MLILKSILNLILLVNKRNSNINSNNNNSNEVKKNKNNEICWQLPVNFCMSKKRKERRDLVSRRDFLCWKRKKILFRKCGLREKSSSGRP